MYKPIALALSFAALAPLNATAGTVENSFGNTVVSRSADGKESLWRYFPDGTFTMTTDGQTVQGAWAYQDGQLCLTLPGSEPTCHGDPGDHRVGDTWTLQGPDGQTTTITIRAGQ